MLTIVKLALFSSTHWKLADPETYVPMELLLKMRKLHGLGDEVLKKDENALMELPQKYLLRMIQIVTEKT